MKFFFTIISLFSFLFSHSQATTEEIKKLHIYKIIEKFFEGKTLEGKTASYFNRQGNIFKETKGEDTSITTREYEYENERLKKVIDYEFEHTTEYFYNPDGSYMTITAEKRFGAKNYSWYRSNGDVIKAFGGDTVFYNYNELGNLDEIKTDSNRQEKIHVKFSYNSKGQLVKAETPKDEYNNLIETYEYDLHGKRIKATTKKMLYGMTRISVTTYKYNKRGLLVKEFKTTKEGNKKWTTKSIYEYEFYEN